MQFAGYMLEGLKYFESAELAQEIRTFHKFITPLVRGDDWRVFDFGWTMAAFEQNLNQTISFEPLSPVYYTGLLPYIQQVTHNPPPPLLRRPRKSCRTNNLSFYNCVPLPPLNLARCDCPRTTHGRVPK